MKRGFFKFGRLALPIIVSAVVSFGRTMPATVDQANAEFDARRANIVKGWVYKYQKDASAHTNDWPQGFKPWCEGDVRSSLREVWAGLFVFANPQYFTQSEFSALSGLPDASFNDQLVEYRNKVYHYLESVEEFETIGTDLGSGYLFLQNDSDARKYWGYNESKVKHGGDYDFVLQNLIQLVYAFIDRPDIMTNDMIWEIISQNNTSKRRLHISSLKCYDKEGWVFDDHFRLYIKQLPSGNRVSIERDMDDGDLWDINSDFDFLEDKIQLDGWDIESDWDDHLGQNIIDRSLKTDASCLFNWDDADYQLKYSVFIPTPDRHIVIESLHCTETEDFTGADEDMLKVMPDGTAKPALTKSMNNGDDWTINTAFAFSNNVRIQLWDEDNDNWTTLWQDDDDLLGDVTIGKDLVEHAIKSFDLDGAHYTMAYSVREGIEGTDMTVGGVQIVNDQVYGKVPVTGQDINDFVNVNFHGKQFIKMGYNFELDYKDSQAETENHMLGIYCWRYLVQNYLEWVASLPATDPRYDARLKKVFESDPQRYRNGTDVTNFVLQMVSRPVYNDLFETNAKMYEAVSINALQTFYSYADKLHSLKQVNPAYGGDKIKAAAQNALDYLSAKFAFQSFEGKRLPPQRRNWDAYRFNYDSHGGNYVSDIFGVLSGEYTYDDSYQAAPPTLPKQTVVKLQKIICSNAEDNVGNDDVRVKINCDGKNMTPLLNRMDTGDEWAINQEFAFNDITKIKIVEEDNDPDDNIGTVTIGTDPVTDATVNLHTFWADYKVVYSVYQKDTTYRPYSVDQIDQHGGFALFSALMDYRLDPAVHDFMLNKHTGYYARVQSRYTDKSYDLDYDGLITKTPKDRGFVKPQYFNADGTIFSTGSFKPITQIYFATPDYLNTAGGKFDRYYDEYHSIGGLYDLWIDPMKGYHEITHPYTLITRDNVNLVNQEEVNELESKMLVMRGMNSYDKRYSDNAEPDSREENNLWTYKSFSYAENYLDQWPQRYPAWWNEWSLPTFTTGGAEYKILDFSNASASSVSLSGYYLILARLTSTNGYNRGFWEIVPKRLYTDAAALQTAIQSTNGQAFTGNTYTYHMMTTGEQIVINKAAGQSQSITAIKDINGNSLPLNDYFLDNSSDESLKKLPLISVRGVDSHYNFNGSEYCYSAGDGYVEINNPFIGRYLRLDSRNYKNPSRTIDMPLLTFEDPRFPWSATGATLQPDKDNKTEGTQSLKVVGTGYMTVMTPRFDTRDLKKVSNQIGIDVYVPSPLTNPYWPGYVELFIDMPSAGIYNQMIGHYDFTSSQAGTWVPVTFTLSDKIVNALSADNPDMQFRIILNTNQNNPYFELDNMRFLRAATEVAQAPVVPINDPSGSFGSFDNMSIWHCSNATLQQVSSPSSDGGTAMQVNGKGYMVITCNNLKSADLAGKGNTMAFDLYIPKAMAGKGWYGSVTLSLTIPSLGIYSAQCNQIDLTNSRTGAFNSLKFQVPGGAAAKLSSKPFTDGQLSIILNTPGDAPAYVVDRLGFVN